MTTIVSTTADLLDRAADLIKERGLAFGDFVDKDGCLCTRGAFHVAVGRDPSVCGIAVGGDCPCLEPSTAIVDFLELDRTYTNDDADAVSNWNDADDRTTGEVVDVLRSVARSVRCQCGDS